MVQVKLPIFSELFPACLSPIKHWSLTKADNWYLLCFPTCLSVDPKRRTSFTSHVYLPTDISLWNIHEAQKLQAVNRCGSYTQKSSRSSCILSCFHLHILVLYCFSLFSRALQCTFNIICFFFKKDYLCLSLWDTITLAFCDRYFHMLEVCYHFKTQHQHWA